jgi:hypothetical protein
METKLNLNDKHTVARAGHELVSDMTKLSADMIAELVYHGLTQKVGDAAAGKKGADALAAMQKVMDALLNGDWGVKRTGGGNAGLGRLETEMAKIYIKATKMTFEKGVATADRYKVAVAEIAERSEAERADLKKLAERAIKRADEDAEASKLFGQKLGAAALPK